MGGCDRRGLVSDIHVGHSETAFQDYIPLTVTCTYASFVISYLSYDKDVTDMIDTVDSDNTVRLSGVRQYKYPEFEK